MEDFRYTGLFGSLDGRFFGQDRATVVNGRHPDIDASEVELSCRSPSSLPLRPWLRIMTLFASARAGRRDLAVLKALGATAPSSAPRWPPRL